MSKYIRNILLILLLMTGVSCQSVIRFSDKNIYNDNSFGKNSSSGKNSSKESKNEKIESTSDSEFRRQYKNLEQKRLNVIREAESWIGTPYQYGGTTSAGVDCSGFVQNVFERCGISMPRTSQQQFTYTMRIRYEELEPGDLIFFGNKGNVSHVGIFGGNGYMIHASTSLGVIRQTLQEYISYQTIQGCGRPEFK